MAFSETGKNLTLEALQSILAKDLASVCDPTTTTLPDSLTLQYMCGRGDWKWKVEWLQEKKSYLNLKRKNMDGGFCRRCRCTSNVNDRHWLDTTGSFYEPAAVANMLEAALPSDLPLKGIPGFHPDMESADVLHCLWLGSAKDACASILADVVEYHPEFLHYESWDLAFQALTTLFHEFCQRHHLDASLIEEISLVKLSIDSINFDYPAGFAKGYTNRVCLAFLAHFLQGTQIEELKFPAVMAWSVTHFGFTLDRAGLFFTDSERLQAGRAGLTYVQTHVHCAREALLRCRPRYKVRPKLHSFLCEIVFKLLHGSTFNPRFTACWADESFIGQVCSVGKAKAVHPSTLSLRLLQRLQLNLNSRLAK